jgi:hypothetical protein
MKKVVRALKPKSLADKLGIINIGVHSGTVIGKIESTTFANLIDVRFDLPIIVKGQVIRSVEAISQAGRKHPIGSKVEMNVSLWPYGGTTVQAWVKKEPG